MSETLYGAQVWQEDRNESDIRYDYLGKNSEVFAVGDILTDHDNGANAGVAFVAGATATVIGVAVKAQTLTSTNTTVAKVYPGFIPARYDTIFLMGTNSDLTGNSTNGGTYYKLTGTTGAMQVDVSSGVQTGTSRIVEIVKVDPKNVGGSGSGSGLRHCLVRFVKTPYYGLETTA